MYSNESNGQAESDFVQNIFVLASYAKQSGRLQKWILEHKPYIEMENVSESKIEESINKINEFFDKSHVKGMNLNIPLSDVIFIFKSFVMGVDEDAVNSKIINDLKKAFIKVQYFIVGENVSDEVKGKNIVEFGVVIEHIYIKVINRMISSYKKMDKSIRNNFIELGVMNKKIKTAEKQRKKQMNEVSTNQHDLINRQEELISVIGKINEK